MINSAQPPYMLNTLPQQDSDASIHLYSDQKLNKIIHTTQSIFALKQNRTDQHMQERKGIKRFAPFKFDDFILLFGDIAFVIFAWIRMLKLFITTNVVLQGALLASGIIGGIINFCVGIFCLRQGVIALGKRQWLEGLRLIFDGMLMIFLGVIMSGGPLLLHFGVAVSIVNPCISFGLAVGFALLSVVVSVEIIKKLVLLCRGTDMGTKCLQQVQKIKDGKIRSSDERQYLLTQLFSHKQLIHIEDEDELLFQQAVLDQMNQEESEIGPLAALKLSQMKINILTWIRYSQQLHEHQEQQKTIISLRQSNTELLNINKSITPDVPSTSNIDDTLHEEINQLQQNINTCLNQIQQDADDLKPLIQAFKVSLIFRAVQQAIYIFSTIVGVVEFFEVTRIIYMAVDLTVNGCVILGNVLAAWMDGRENWALERNVPDGVPQPSKIEVAQACKTSHVVQPVLQKASTLQSSTAA